MTEPEQPNSDKDFPDASDNASFGSDSVNSDSQSNKSNTETNNNTGNDKKSEPIINETRNNEDAAIVEARTANRFTKYGLYVNAFLLLCTLGALLFTWLSLNDARKKDIQSAIRDSTNDSNNRIKDSIYNERDSIKYALTKFQFENSRKKDSISTALAKKSLETQIDAIKESQTQFAINNQPYLGCSNFAVNTFDSGKQHTITYEASNLGATPVKMISSRYYCDFLTAPPIKPFDYFIKQNIPFREIVNNIGRGSPIPLLFTSDKILTSFYYNAAKEKVLFIFFWGEIKYVNLVSLKESTYRFLVKVDPPPGKSYLLILNEND